MAIAVSSVWPVEFFLVVPDPHTARVYTQMMGNECWRYLNMLAHSLMAARSAEWANVEYRFMDSIIEIYPSVLASCTCYVTLGNPFCVRGSLC